MREITLTDNFFKSSVRELTMLNYSWSDKSTIPLEKSLRSKRSFNSSIKSPSDNTNLIISSFNLRESIFSYSKPVKKNTQLYFLNYHELF